MSTQALFRDGPKEVAELVALALVCEDPRFEGEDRQSCLALRRKALAPS